MKMCLRMAVRGILLLALFVSCHAHQMPPRPIPFTEPEPFSVSPGIARQLGYEKLTVTPGPYEVRFDRENPNGVVVLDLSEATPIEPPAAALTAPGPIIKITIKINIARRDRNCMSGLGFRCGFSADEPSEGSFLARVQVSERTLKIEMQEPVPWERLEQPPRP